MLKKKLTTICLCLFSVFAFAQTGTLKGKVTDSAGTPVEAAIVQVENTKLLTSTDSKGNYKIENIPVGNYSVLVEIVGANSVEQKAEIKEKQTTELTFSLTQKVNQLKRVEVVRPIVSSQGMGHMPETYQAVNYSGLKTEVLVLDSLDANKAQDNFRETLGRMPGSNYSETQGGGFPANGIAFRGLIPTQSVEIQTRQNGYNIAADVYGYPESYYLPPLMVVKQETYISGAAALQFGPQFGGIIDYEIKDAPLDKPLEIGVSETGGSYDFTNTVLTIGGTLKKWHYFAFGDYRYTSGWRPNSNLNQIAAYAKLEYDASDKFTIGLEYTLLRNLIHMPGGLTDAEFDENPDQSFRSRNWLSTPWNIMTLTADYKISDKTELVLKSTGNMSARYLVWKSEDGGPQQADSISAITGTYQPREVGEENFLSTTNEARFITHYNLGSVNCILATGVRYFQGDMWQEESTNSGSTGTNYDLSLLPGTTWADSLHFTTTNIAPFIENTFHFGNLSVTPGFRYEYIQSSANGYSQNEETLVQTGTDVTKTWYIPLFGCRFQYKTTDNTSIYANIVQAYEPTTYENLAPIGQNLTIDANLKDAYGYNSDLGWRGKISNYLNFDVGLFYLVVDDEIGNISNSPFAPPGFLYETNPGNSVHKGAETYVEMHIFKMLSLNPKIGDFSFFNSYAYDDSRYVSGPFQGNYEEMAPVDIERIGLNYTYSRFSITLLYSYSSLSYADANNTVFSEDAEAGIIPAYHVVDWSSTYKYKKYILSFGISNLLNEKYFNLRTTEYPGPGIIPAPARNFYVGLSATF